MRERNRLQASVDGYEDLVREFSENVELIELAESENDLDIASEAEN